MESGRKTEEEYKQSVIKEQDETITTKDGHQITVRAKATKKGDTFRLKSEATVKILEKHGANKNDMSPPSITKIDSNSSLAEETRILFQQVLASMREKGASKEKIDEVRLRVQQEYPFLAGSLEETKETVEYEQSLGPVEKKQIISDAVQQAFDKVIKASTSGDGIENLEEFMRMSRLQLREIKRQYNTQSSSNLFKKSNERNTGVVINKLDELPRPPSPLE